MSTWLYLTLSAAAVAAAVPVGLAARRLLDNLEAARLRANQRSRR